MCEVISSKDYKMISKVIFFVLPLLCFAKGQKKPDFLNLQEGSKCSKDGVNGVCASIYKCLTAAQDIRDEDFPSVCTYREGTQIICCTDCELALNDTRYMYISPTSGQWYWRNGQTARDKCIDYMQELEPCLDHFGEFTTSIPKYLDKKRNCYVPRATPVVAVGGSDALRDHFRHMALLGYGPDENAAYWICGGSLISENFVLTAGHCTMRGTLGPVKYIGLGILKRTDPLELWQRYYVKRIINHPEYQPPSKYNDIALLETQGRVKFNSHVIPACIHFEVLEKDYMAEATGWGALGQGREFADNLQTVDLEEFTKKDCSKLYGRHSLLKNGYDHQTQMCYGNHQEIKDTCQGDSGGPLQNNYHISACQFVVVGVTSTGRQCGKVGSTGLYTKVLHYRRWIEDLVWP